MLDKCRSKYEKILNLKYTLTIVVTLIIVILGLTVGQDELQESVLNVLSLRSIDAVTFMQNIYCEMDFVGTAVWTLTTILFAFIVFYYSALGFRNYGLANRKLIALKYGTCFIPVLVCLNAVSVLSMTVFYYIAWHTAFYLLAAYSFFIQIILICLCVYSSTQYNAVKTIISVETEQFYSLYGHPSKKFQKQNKIAPDKIVYYMRYILNGEEMLAEKKRIISSVLLIPFQREYSFIKEDLSVLYARQYKNFKYISDYAAKNQEEASEVLNMISSVMAATYTLINSGAEDVIKAKLYVAYSALFNALLSERGLQNKWTLIEYLINSSILSEQLRMELSVVLFMVIQYLSCSEQIIFTDGDEIREIEKTFREIKIQQNFLSYMDYMYLLHKETDRKSPEIDNYRQMILAWGELTNLNKMQCYEMVYEIETKVYNSKEQTSGLIFYLQNYCIGGEKND